MANTFLALLPDEETQSYLQARQRDLRAWGLEGRWTHALDLHLTLVFLGSLDQSMARKRARAVSDVANATSPIEVPIAGLGALLRKQQVKVIYSALNDPDGVLADLHFDSSDALGTRANDDFMPHISLMRPETVQQLPEMFHAFVEHDGVAASFDQLALLRREGSNGGPLYRAVQQWQLS